MTESTIRLFRSSEVERDQDDDSLMEVLPPSVSGVADIWFSRFASFRAGRIPAHYHTSNSIAYLVRGKAAFLTGRRFEARHEMAAGDYVTVPAGLHHMEETIGDETAEFILVRDGGGGTTVYLEDAPPEA
ncbi:MAG: cupin domain-containing protein [Candidatus Dormibacteraeota bacterium]|nr:cupin domain-containing protein [Candidatus Dormibacteraeota bacterium]